VNDRSVVRIHQPVAMAKMGGIGKGYDANAFGDLGNERGGWAAILTKSDRQGPACLVGISAMSATRSSGYSTKSCNSGGSPHATSAVR
jgi:hypothetical protein